MTTRRKGKSSSISSPRKTTNKGIIPDSGHSGECEENTRPTDNTAPSSFFKLWTSASFAVIFAIMAISFALGLQHQSQGMDLADNIINLLQDYSGAVSDVPSLSNWDAAQMPHKAQRQKQRRRTSKEVNRRLAPTLSRNMTVLIHDNGESTPAGSLYLEPKTTTSIEELKSAVGLVIDACHGGTCRVFDRYGYEIKALGALHDEQLLFAVPPNRHFVWPAFEIGHRVAVPGVTSSLPGHPIFLETLSDSPRVFLVENFLSAEDADEVIETTLGITAAGFALKRSTTGTQGAVVSSHRTSENAFDTTSPVAMKLKRRVFDLLGMRPYVETWADGLQVLRYNASKAYIPHMDYLEFDSNADHNFDSASPGGTNRFATVLLYLTDVEEGGETVFPLGEPLEKETRTTQEIQAEARARGRAADLTPGSWEEEMTETCISRLAVKPQKGRAVLFYSQNPDGTPDERSLHGACPVVKGVKWAANLWVWNGPRFGHSATSPAKEAEGKIQAVFSSAVEGVALYWETTRWGKMGPGEAELKAMTYQGHKWNVRRDEGDEQGAVLASWTIEAEKAEDGVIQYRYEG